MDANRELLTFCDFLGILKPLMDPLPGDAEPFRCVREAEFFFHARGKVS